jgi:hypothetical protein
MARDLGYSQRKRIPLQPMPQVDGQAAVLGFRNVFRETITGQLHTFWPLSENTSRNSECAEIMSLSGVSTLKG